MKPTFKSVLLISLFVGLNAANATINTNYQYGTSKAIGSPESAVIAVTNEPITLNPELDEIDVNDPRIKSVIDYVHRQGLGVSVVFFNSENLRYAKKVNEMFNKNHVYTTLPQMAQSKNRMDFNLVKIYVIQDKTVKLESTNLTKRKGGLVQCY